MANLTIVVDAEVLRRARARAALVGESLNAMLRRTLEDLAAGDLEASIGEELRGQVARLFPEPRPHRERSWTRDELYDRGSHAADG